MQSFRESVRRLIVETSIDLPPDVRRALLGAVRHERPGGRSAFALNAIALNVDLADDRQAPICQDTGLPIFEVKVPAGRDQLALAEAISEAVTEATREGMLRPNSVDPLTGANSGSNLGPGMPAVHFEEWLSDDVEVRLLLKGGGSENVSAQYSLPCDLPVLGRADRDLDGVRKCILHAVHQAQGHGCSAGVLGVGVGGDRGNGYTLAKQQLFRTLDDTNPDPELARLEKEIVGEANALGIGTMGFGGAVTLLGCKIGVANRLPASFFVSIAYNCWALRRLGVRLDGETGAIKEWLYRDTPAVKMAEHSGLPLTGREVRLRTPLAESAVRGLEVGDVVLIDGVIHTGRDALHRHLVDHDPPVDLRGAALFHCGPVALKRDGVWDVSAAGPTTSIREEPYQAEILKRHGVRAVIGKGGMGARTLSALEFCGAVYLSAIGGAAQFYADRVTEVEGVDFLELGVPEAMWHLRVRDFPAIVTMDSHGRSLHEAIERESSRALAYLNEPVGA